MAGEKRTLQVSLVKGRRSGVDCLSYFVCWSASLAQVLAATCKPNQPFLTRGDRPDGRRKKVPERTVFKRRLLLYLVSTMAQFAVPGVVASSKLGSLHATTKRLPLRLSYMHYILHIAKS